LVADSLALVADVAFFSTAFLGAAGFLSAVFLGVAAAFFFSTLLTGVWLLF